MRLYTALQGLHLTIGYLTGTGQKVHDLIFGGFPGPFLLVASALSSSLPCGAAFCFGMHAEARGSASATLLPCSTAVSFGVHAEACALAPHINVILLSCCDFGDIAGAEGVDAIVRRARWTWASPVQLDESG